MTLVVGGAAIALIAATGPVWAGNKGQPENKHKGPIVTTTPIKHLVVIFDENISFDHYFGTYPNATNADGTPFSAKKNTPKVNGLSPQLLTHNPNLFNPTRLGPSQALTCDQNHGYGAEQAALDGGKADMFVQDTETDKCTGQPILFGQPGLVMDYYDGNTVTGLWNYAQNYAMSDNSFDTVFGPSTPGAVNLVSGNTHGIVAVNSVTHTITSDPFVVQSPNGAGVGTVINDPDPAWDDCADTNHTSTFNLGAMEGTNIGDLMNRKGITWGWFQGGFKPTVTAADSPTGFAVCGATHNNVGGIPVVDYSAHHNPFEYYLSTANPHHLPPTSVAMIGQTDQANHEYDLTDFNAAVAANNIPSVSFLKAPEYEDGHAGYSDPLDEQRFLVNTINSLEHSSEWSSTAVVIAYDDSDGWYDHVSPPIVNGSTDGTADQAALCGNAPISGDYADRCGYGPRLPMLVISPWSKANFVDHHTTEQTSVLTFIEDNWLTGHIGDSSFDRRSNSVAGMLDFHQRPNTRPVILDPTTGAVVSH
ncbi:MAG TPA: alkaline phosphatase family protein [Micromonosporaceae bacterium]|jgi:phospholipase C|nr:alkaline phosphatase family protein [Micromonosporaceae bacterium]